MTDVETTPLRVESMTSRQLVRRAKLIEAVIDLVEEVGCQAVQMREVADRSGVALGTMYRYFRSKDHLLAAALAEWQERLTRRVVAAGRSADEEPFTQVSSYLRRALRAFHRNPEMAMLMAQVLTSNDPDVVAILERMRRTDGEVMSRLLAGLPPQDIPYVSLGIDATLMSAVTSMVTGRQTLESSIDRVQGVARLLINPRSRNG